MKLFLIIGIPLFFISRIFLFSPESVTSEKQIRAANNLSQASAKDNFLKYCAGCHGTQMERFAGNTWEAFKAGNDLTPVIKNGLPELGMPSFDKAFSDAEMKAISNYILTEIKGRKQAPVAAKFPAVVRSKHQAFRIDTVAKGLDVPWGIAFLPDGDMLVTERSGQLFRFSGGKLKAIISGVPEVYAQGQGGLMDIVLHPKYQQNGWIYISYSQKAPDGVGGNTAIFRAKLKDNKLAEQQELFKAMPNSTKGVHFGCRMVFDDQGYLFFSVGERGEMNNAQTLTNHCGKIHRIFDDGRIPPDNPFVNTPGAMPTIYSYGHRNPQGIDIHPVSRRIYNNEHGPRGGDEINLVGKGNNYGWPVITFGINYDGTIITKETAKAGMEQPVFQWTPSIGPSSMKFVTGNRYPGWKGDILNGSLSFKYLERVRLEGGKVTGQEKLLENAGRVRNVTISPDGYIYVAVENPGIIVKLIPVN
ncbi:MAG: PQQ-dependent sugar dehydrogenase [Prolixibacteraceae bacterium]|nr:PQQ-dependent sugar dehydrogenase [Prolixibacteraceae bacterium]